MKRVAFLVPHAEPGGGERMIADLCRSLNRSEFEPHVILPKPGRLSEMLRSSQTKVAHVPFRRDLFCGYPPGFGFKTLKALVQQLRDWNIDLLHLNDSYLALLGGVAGRKLGIPVVMTAHGPWDAHFLIQDLFNRRYLDRIWAPLNGVRDAVIKRGIVLQEKVKVVHFGVDVDRFSPGNMEMAKKKLGISPEKVVCIRVARFDKVKDYPTFLRAAERTAGVCPTAFFLIVGDVVLDIPSEKSVYKQQALDYVSKSATLRDRVKFVGYQDDVRPYVEAADILVSSSKSESVGFTILEAMAMGKPVVSTSKGGPSEIISDPSLGSLVPPEDPMQLSAAMTNLINNQGLRRQMGAAGQRHVHVDYNLKNFARSMEREYTEVLGGHKN